MVHTWLTHGPPLHSCVTDPSVQDRLFGGNLWVNLSQCVLHYRWSCCTPEEPGVLGVDSACQLSRLVTAKHRAPDQIMHGWCTGRMGFLIYVCWAGCQSAGTA